MGKNFYQGSDASVLTGSANFAALITADPTLYGLVAGQAASYSLVNSAYASAYTAAKDPSTRTKGKVEAKQQAKLNLRTAAAFLVRIINGTETVTNEQKIDLGINVRATPAPIPAPSARPAVSLIGVVGRKASVAIRQDATSTRRARPAGVLGANVYSFVGADYPTDPAAWAYEGATTKGKFDVTFPDSVPGGAKVWICATWYNAKAETGPTSFPIMAYIQGGMSLAA